VNETTQILAELRALREDVQHLERRLLDGDDRRELARLLPLVHRLMGGSVWTAANLYEVAALQTSAQPLLLLLDEWNTERGGLRQFGHFLARVRGASCAGLRLVETGGGDRLGVLYTVKRV
jgi:hypothetical protein